jgi:addiction module HigA family antidote
MMKNPPHPGEVLRELCIEPLGLSVTEAANHLGVARKTLSELLNGHAGISADMAVRLSRAFGGSAESWVLMQAHYDLAQALAQDTHPEIQPFARESVVSA